MLNENAKKWVAALRSGRFTQGQFQLEGDNKNCCLGVACRVAIENGLSLSVRKNLKTRIVKFNGCYLFLPNAVQVWLNLETQRGRHKSACGDADTLSSLNDTGASFSAIADLIESEPEGLFETQEG